MRGKFPHRKNIRKAANTTRPVRPPAVSMPPACAVERAAASEKALVESTEQTEEWVRVELERERLTLVRAPGTLTGYTCVILRVEAHTERRKPYFVQLSSFDKQGARSFLGYHATAIEAAFAYARHLGPAASALAASEVEAHDFTDPLWHTDATRLPLLATTTATATREGLQLHQSGRGRHGSVSHTGWKGVYSAGKRFAVRVNRGGTTDTLGRFDTLDEAVLYFARFGTSEAKGAAPGSLLL